MQSKIASEPQREKLVHILSCVLRQLFSNRNTEKLPSDPALITMFHTMRAPSISIEDYFQRIAKYSECSAECLVLSLVHLNRILHYRPNFQVNSLSIHRLLLTSLMCSAKFFDDHYFNNAFYAKVGGVSTKEMNSLEVEFLAIINFDLFVNPQVYSLFFRELCNPRLHSAGCGCDIKGLDPLFNVDPVAPGEPLPPHFTIPSQVTQPQQSQQQQSQQPQQQQQQQPQYREEKSKFGSVNGFVNVPASGPVLHHQTGTSVAQPNRNPTPIKSTLNPHAQVFVSPQHANSKLKAPTPQSSSHGFRSTRNHPDVIMMSASPPILAQ